MTMPYARRAPKIEPGNVGHSLRQRPSLLRGFGAALLLCIGTIAAAQNPKEHWQALHNAAAAAPRFGEPKRELEIARQALELAEQLWGEEHPNVATSLSLYAELYAIAGPDAIDTRYRAQQMHRRALEMRKRFFGPSHLYVAQSLEFIALIDRTEGAHRAALNGLLEALDIRQSSLGSMDPSLTLDLGRIGDELVTLNQLELAQSYHERELSLSGLQAATSRDDRRARQIQIAAEHGFRGGRDYAEFVLKRALMDDERAFGDLYPGSKSLLIELASLYAEADTSDQAESMLRRALIIDEHEYGPADWRVNDSLQRLADFYIQNSHYDQAEELLDRVIATAETAPKSERLQQVNALRDLAAVHEHTARPDSAQRLKRQSYALERSMKPMLDGYTQLALVVINLPLLCLALVATVVIGQLPAKRTLWLWLSLVPHAATIAWTLSVGAAVPLLAASITAAMVVVAYRSADAPQTAEGPR